MEIKVLARAKRLHHTLGMFACKGIIAIPRLRNFHVANMH
jgi:hypothetical protein